MKIAFDAKRYYHNNTGLGNYSRTLVGNMQTFFPENEYVLYDESSLRRTFCLGNKAKKDGCDLFHGLSNELPVDIKIPSVVTIHDVCWRTFPEMYHFFDRHIYDLKYGSSCKRADKIIAISESTKRDIMDYYGVKEEKIEVIYQPVQEYYYTPLAENEAMSEHTSMKVGGKVRVGDDDFIPMAHFGHDFEQRGGDDGRNTFQHSGSTMAQFSRSVKRVGASLLPKARIACTMRA